MKRRTVTFLLSLLLMFAGGCSLFAAVSTSRDGDSRLVVTWEPEGYAAHSFGLYSRNTDGITYTELPARSSIGIEEDIDFGVIGSETVYLGFNSVAPYASGGFTLSLKCGDDLTNSEDAAAETIPWTVTWTADETISGATVTEGSVTSRSPNTAVKVADIIPVAAGSWKSEGYVPLTIKTDSLDGTSASGTYTSTITLVVTAIETGVSDAAGEVTE